jgi:integrase
VRDRRADGAYIEVNIPSQAKELMKKYADKERMFRFHRQYADESGFNKALNIGLRTVAKDIGVDSLQFYQARHTWASIARNDCGIDAYTVDKALNHISKDLQLLDVYVKRDFSAINKANKKVIDFVFQ